ncbi:hypothetical protein [Photobacterium galatheae]|uniref:Uncharacterized protein n=1 Tax=Photobacterium galatheae TaxID=1654360 RepID=A0A066RI68_9GAMM|nr:hypothetical protein [Photobacterium galatheae]KDM90019.1 hypothetical protein EA58_18935 [Photobacterium galatheae]MCM0150000.1 hypothetical protein [Photobacterium galatheae]
MDSFTSLFLWAYLALGSVATLYAVFYFFLSGLTIFDQGKKKNMPLRFKCSYVFVMFLMMPIFYLIFIEEILALSRYFKANKQSMA